MTTPRRLPLDAFLLLGQHNPKFESTYVNQFCAHAVNDDVRNLLRKYKTEMSDKDLVSKLGAGLKDVLVATMEYLNAPDLNQGKCTKPRIVNNIIRRIRNLFPDHCAVCRVSTS